MALSRVQLLMGDDQQGAVLQGEVQAVKQGAGIFIDTDGTISVDASSVSGLVKLNRLNAFNGYIWPETKGTQGQVLTLGTGDNLVWSNGGVFVNSNPPTNPEVGDLWFDCSTGQLLVYEDCTSGSPKWTSGSEGFPVLPGNTSGSPTFAGGDGTLASPYICSASSASVSGAIVVNRVTIINLAPFQFVPIVDLNAVANGGRFSASNNVADGSGILVFDLLFTDSPTSLIGANYVCALKVGYGSVYIDATVTLTDVFVLNSAGAISGIAQVNLPLTYTPGTAAGGAPPYNTSWIWKRFGDNATLQQGGLQYTPNQSEFGNAVYVTLTIQDSEGQIVSGSTSDYGPISKPPFPNPTPPSIPTNATTTSCFTWDGAPTTLESDGCLLFRVGAGQFTQGPTPVGAGANVCTKWDDSTPGICANAPSGDFIDGCLYNDNFSTCGSLTLNRVPSAFVLPTAVGAPGATVTSSPAPVLTGFNATAYVTYDAASTGTSISASTDGNTYFPLSTSGTSFPIQPGQTLFIRMILGSTPSTDYTAIIKVGSGSSFTTSTFTGQATVPGFSTVFSPIGGPDAIPGSVNSGGLDGTAEALSWADGTTMLQSTGCLFFQVNGSGGFDQGPKQVQDGESVELQWNPGTGCGEQPNGSTIQGTLTNGQKTNFYELIIDKAPTGFVFSDLDNQTPSSTVLSDVVTPASFNAPVELLLGASSTLSNVQVSKNLGPFNAIPSTSPGIVVNPGDSLRIRGTTGSTALQSYTAILTLGTATTTWTVENSNITPTINTPSIVAPFNGSQNVNPAVNIPVGVNVEGTGYISSGGAGAHVSSDWQVYEGGFPSSVQSTNTISSFSSFTQFSSYMFSSSGWAVGQTPATLFSGGSASGTAANSSISYVPPFAIWGIWTFNTGRASCPSTAYSYYFNNDFYPNTGCQMGSYTGPLAKWIWTSAEGWGVSCSSVLFNGTRLQDFSDVGIRVVSIANMDADGFLPGFRVRGSVSGATGTIGSITASRVIITLDDINTDLQIGDKLVGAGTAILNVTNDTQNLISINVPQADFEFNTAYVCRVRYNSASTNSNYSPFSTFYTGANFNPVFSFYNTSTTNNLTDIASNGLTQYLIVGGNSTQTTNNFSTYQSRSNPGTRGKAIYAFGKYITLETNGTITTATDPASWNTQTSGLTSGSGGFAYDPDNGILAAAGGNVVSTSTDGVVWTPQSTGLSASFSITAMAYGNGTFAIAAVDTGTPGYLQSIRFSTDGGVNWTPVTNPLPINSGGDMGNGIIRSMFYQGGNWIMAATGISGAPPPEPGRFRVYVSSNNGTSWNTTVDELNLGGSTIGYFSGMASNGSRIQAAITNGSTSGGVRYSDDDGLTWRSAPVSSGPLGQGVRYLDGRYWFPASAGTLIVSP